MYLSGFARLGTLTSCLMLAAGSTWLATVDSRVVTSDARSLVSDAPAVTSQRHGILGYARNACDHSHEGDADGSAEQSNQPAFCTPPCTADITRDGRVDVQDLLKVLATWGPCDGCPTDFNSDGMVDVIDLLMLLGAWGACPPSQGSIFSLVVEDMPGFVVTDGVNRPSFFDVFIEFVACPLNDEQTFWGLQARSFSMGASSVPVDKTETGGISFTPGGEFNGYWNSITGEIELTGQFNVHYWNVENHVASTRPHPDFLVPHFESWQGGLVGSAFFNGNGDIALVAGTIAALTNVGIGGAASVSVTIAALAAKKLYNLPACAEAKKGNKKKVCIQVWIVRDNAGQNPAGASYAQYKAAAEAIWGKCCVEFEWLDGNNAKFIDDTNLQIIDGPIGAALAPEEKSLFDKADPKGNNKCIDVIFVKSYANPAHGSGCGVCHGGGTNRAQVIVQDAAVTACNPASVRGLAHELGHALGNLSHENGNIMEPQGNPPNCPGLHSNKVTKAHCEALKIPLLKPKDPKQNCCNAWD